MVSSLIIIALLIGSVGVVMLADDWRFSLPALAALYVVGGILLGIETTWVLGFVQTLAGLISVAVIASTMRALPASRNDTLQYAFGLPYRLVAGLFALAVAYSLADTYPFTDASAALNFAVYWLGAAGLMALVLARRMLPVGYAVMVLTLVSDMLLTLFSQGPGLTRQLLAAIAQIALSLALSYLLAIERESEPAS